MLPLLLSQRGSSVLDVHYRTREDTVTKADRNRLSPATPGVKAAAFPDSDAATIIPAFVASRLHCCKPFHVLYLELPLSTVQKLPLVTRQEHLTQVCQRVCIDFLQLFRHNSRCWA